MMVTDNTLFVKTTKFQRYPWENQSQIGSKIHYNEHSAQKVSVNTEAPKTGAPFDIVLQDGNWCSPSCSKNTIIKEYKTYKLSKYSFQVS